MTLEEARGLIGQKVAYDPGGGCAPEEGVVTSVNKRFVFVRYGADYGSKATPPEMLVPLSASPGAIGGESPCPSP